MVVGVPLARPAGMEDAELLKFEDQRRDQRLHRTILAFARQTPWRRWAKAMTAGRRSIVYATGATHGIGQRSERMRPPNLMHDLIFPVPGTRLNSQNSLREINFYKNRK